MNIGISHVVAFLFILHKNGNAFLKNLFVTEEYFNVIGCAFLAFKGHLGGGVEYSG